MEEIEAFLDKLESMDSYWQKFEWINLRQDNPELYDRVVEYKRERGDPDVQGEIMQIAGLIFVSLIWLFAIYISTLDD